MLAPLPLQKLKYGVRHVFCGLYRHYEAPNDHAIERAGRVVGKDVWRVRIVHKTDIMAQMPPPIV